MQYQKEHAPLYPHSALPLLKENNTPTPPSAPAPVLAPSTAVLLGPENTITVCQFCHASIKTAVRYTVTTRTHITAALFAALCCCCCIPYWSESAKNSDHYCPNCQRYLGTYKK